MTMICYQWGISIVYQKMLTKRVEVMVEELVVGVIEKIMIKGAESREKNVDQMVKIRCVNARKINVEACDFSCY